ncbi:MAG: hypothetical protein AAGJ95_16030 [Cyanobacteria bacterium J06554_11]
MVRGLLWLPLLAVFFGLAWAGWNEYCKVEGYKIWATQFERAKYDIYAVLGQKGDVLTWGVPTRQGIIQAEQLNLLEVVQLAMEVNSEPMDPESLPTKGRFALGFTLKDGSRLSVPFTEGEMAKQWFDFIRSQWSL